MLLSVAASSLTNGDNRSIAVAAMAPMPGHPDLQLSHGHSGSDLANPYLFVLLGRPGPFGALIGEVLASLP